MFETATQFFDMKDHQFVDLDGPSVSHYSDVNTRKTRCGLDFGVYYDGWIWGSEKGVTCEKCLENL